MCTVQCVHLLEEKRNNQKVLGKNMKKIISFMRPKCDRQLNIIDNEFEWDRNNYDLLHDEHAIRV